MIGRALPIVIALGFSAMAACGDDAPSKQDFLAEVDPICKRGNDIAAAFTTPSDLPTMKDFGAKLADNITKTADEIAELDQPGGGDGTAAAEMVKAMQDAAEAARAIDPEVDKGNFPGVEVAVGKAVEAFKNAAGKARTFGSAECGKGEAAAASKLGKTGAATVKTAYIAKADAACASYIPQFDAIAEPDTFAQVRDFLDRSIALAEKLTSELKAIPPPSVDRAKLDEAFTSNDVALAKLKEAAAAAGAGNQPKTVQLTDEAVALGDAANASADAYGFKDCGSQGG